MNGNLLQTTKILGDPARFSELETSCFNNFKDNPLLYMEISDSSENSIDDSSDSIILSDQKELNRYHKDVVIPSFSSSMKLLLFKMFKIEHFPFHIIKKMISIVIFCPN